MKNNKKIKYKVFDKNEYATMYSFANILIPQGDDPVIDPGAVDTDVVFFIDTFLTNDKVALQNDIKGYLKKLNEKSLKLKNKSFSNLDEKSQSFIVSKFESENFNSFAWLRRLVFTGFYSNYRPAQYKGKTTWETIGYLGPMTWAEMTRTMSNPTYSKEQTVKESVQI